MFGCVCVCVLVCLCERVFVCVRARVFSCVCACVLSVHSYIPPSCARPLLPLFLCLCLFWRTVECRGGGNTICGKFKRDNGLGKRFLDSGFGRSSNPSFGLSDLVTLDDFSTLGYQASHVRL